MNPLDYIKEGILNGNWETVCEGYERLTDEALPIPKDNRVNDILNLIIEIVNQEKCNTLSSNVSEKKKTGRPKGSGKKKVKNKNIVNENGEDSSLKLDQTQKTIIARETDGVRLITNDPDPEEIEQNKTKAAKTKHNKIKRQPARTFKAKCNECDKEFDSNRKDGEMGQKCSTCMNNLKGRHG